MLSSIRARIYQTFRDWLISFSMMVSSLTYVATNNCIFFKNFFLRGTKTQEEIKNKVFIYCWFITKMFIIPGFGPWSILADQNPVTSQSLQWWEIGARSRNQGLNRSPLMWELGILPSILTARLNKCWPLQHSLTSQSNPQSWHFCNRKCTSFSALNIL